MHDILVGRLENHRMLRKFWVAGNIKGAIDALAKIRDLPVILTCNIDIHINLFIVIAHYDLLI